MRTTFAWLWLVAVQLTAQAPTTLDLTGHVVDMWGEPVPAARVEAYATDGRELLLARSPSDGEGAFRLAKLPVAGPWRVRAWARSTSVAEALVDDPALPLRLVVFDAITLRGVVRDRDGQPVAGAAVEATPRLRSQPGSVAATTDAEGAFTIGNLPRGLIHVLAVVPGEGLHTASVRATADTTAAPTRLDAATKALTVRVEGLGAEWLAKTHVEVKVAGIFRLPPPWRRPDLDADAVTLRDLPGRDPEVRLRCPGVRFQPTWQRQKANENGELCFRAEVMQAERTVCRLRLVDVEGHAVCGVPVSLATATPPARIEARTDAAGCATFPVMAWPGSKGSLRCLDERWAALTTPEASKTGDREFRLDDEDVQLLATPGCTFAGRILSPAGVPAPGVLVAVSVLPKSGQPWLVIDQVVTNGDGTFRLPGLPRSAATHRLDASSPLGFTRSKELAIASGNNAVADLQLVAAATIRGIVSTADGQPAPGVRVWHRHWNLADDRAADGDVREVVTDAEGRYCIAGTRAGGNFLQTLVDELDSSERAVPPFATTAGQVLVVDLTVKRR